jgi:hypothetical protein
VDGDTAGKLRQSLRCVLLAEHRQGTSHLYRPAVIDEKHLFLANSGVCDVFALPVALIVARLIVPSGRLRERQPHAIPNQAGTLKSPVLEEQIHDKDDQYGFSER